MFREFIWTETRLVIHESELREFFSDRKAGKIGWLPRRPVKHVPWDGVERPETRFWRRCPTVSVGDWWMDEVNQGIRDGEVIAVDERACQWLWEYSMPGGTSAIVRCGWVRGELIKRSISIGELPDKWLKLICEDFVVGNPKKIVDASR